VNIYDYITPKSGETFTTLLEHKNIKINRIVSSNELNETEYIQEEDEWLVLLEGEATLLLNDEKKTLTKGEMLFIPSKTRHRILSTKSGTVWLTVHIF
jgi:cupin 2 domain-containing protein